MQFRPYDWNIDASEDPEAVAEPNFWIEGHPLRIEWYKHSGRGMQSNLDLSANEWVAWHDLVQASLQAFDEDSASDEAPPPAGDPVSSTAADLPR